MGRGLVLSAGLVGGVAGAPILCVLLQEAHEALPRGAYVMRCGHGGLRPWDAVAVVRRRTGGVLQRGGRRGSREFGAACVVCRVVQQVSLRCFYSCMCFEFILGGFLSLC